MTLLQQIKALTALGFTLEIRDATGGGFDIVMRNKLGRHLWCNVTAAMVAGQDEPALSRALHDCENQAVLPPG
jgi:hypothetical protein